MISLQVFVSQQNFGIQKQQHKPGSGSQRTGKAWILPPTMAWIWRGFFGAEKKAINSGRFRDRVCDKIRASFCYNSGPDLQNQKFTVSTHPNSISACSLGDCVLSSQTERPSENALMSFCTSAVAKVLYRKRARTIGWPPAAKGRHCFEGNSVPCWLGWQSEGGPENGKSQGWLGSEISRRGHWKRGICRHPILAERIWDEFCLDLRPL